MLRKHTLLFAPDAGGGSGTAPAAAPVAPAAAPAAPAAAPAADKGAPAASKDPFDELDARLDAKRKPATTPKADDKAKEDLEKPAVDPADPKRRIAPALRDQLEKVSTEKKQLQESISTLETKIKDYESRGKDSTALAEQLAAREKELETIRGELRAARQEVSPEFKAKWEKPFKQAADYAKSVIEQLIVTGEDGNTRQATWDDFAQLYNLPYTKAIAGAQAMFGDASQVVVNHLTELQRLAFQKREALEEEKANWKKRETEDAARSASERQATEDMWGKVTKDIADKKPHLFAPDPKDPEGNELLTEGYKIVDAKPETLEQRIIQAANIRHRAAAFPRLIHRLDRAKERVAELEAENAELRGSGPGPTKRTGGADPAPDGDWRTELRKEMA